MRSDWPPPPFVREIPPIFNQRRDKMFRARLAWREKSGAMRQPQALL
jgi:hypothetical protein